MVNVIDIDHLHCQLTPSVKVMTDEHLGGEGRGGEGRGGEVNGKVEMDDIH